MASLGEDAWKNIIIPSVTNPLCLFEAQFDFPFTAACMHSAEIIENIEFKSTYLPFFSTLNMALLIEEDKDKMK